MCGQRRCSQCKMKAGGCVETIPSPRSPSLAQQSIKRILQWDYFNSTTYERFCAMVDPMVVHLRLLPVFLAFHWLGSILHTVLLIQSCRCLIKKYQILMRRDFCPTKARPPLHSGAVVWRSGCLEKNAVLNSHFAPMLQRNAWPMLLQGPPQWSSTCSILLGGLPHQNASPQKCPTQASTSWSWSSFVVVVVELGPPPMMVFVIWQ